LECKSPSEFKPILININGHVTQISPHDYLIYIEPLCIIGFIDLGEKINFVLLGDTYLKGTYIIHDMENKLLGLYP